MKDIIQIIDIITLNILCIITLILLQISVDADLIKIVNFKMIGIVMTVIEKLQKMPPNLPVYVRPKYHGDLKWCDKAEVKLTGVFTMEEQDGARNVTFLV